MPPDTWLLGDDGTEIRMSNIDRPVEPGRAAATGTDVASRPADAPTQGSSSGGVKEQAGQAVGTATEEGKHVTAVAGEEAQHVAAEAKQQAQVLLEDARGQVEEQSRMQRDRLVQTLTTLGDDLDRMSSQADSGMASQLVQQAAQRVRGISSRLEGREPAELLDEVRDFARRKPGTFLFGALAAGVVAGRLTRGAQKARSSSSGGPSSTTTSPLGSTSMPAQRSPGMVPETSALPETPSAPATASFPPDQPGEIR
jgi:hypothetical protein